MICIRADLARAADEFQRSRVALLHRAVDAKPLREEASLLAERQGVDVRRPEGLVYRVVPGDVLRGTAIGRLYRSRAMRRVFQAITGARVFISPHERSAVNVNRLAAVGDQYRWHFDAHPFSALLYLTDAEPDDGGELLMRPPAGKPITFLPRAGTLVVFDGTVVEHSVAPIRRPCERLSVPMVFPAVPNLPRPEGLDEYLYRP